MSVAAQKQGIQSLEIGLNLLAPPPGCQNRVPRDAAIAPFATGRATSMMRKARWRVTPIRLGCGNETGRPPPRLSQGGLGHLHAHRRLFMILDRRLASAAAGLSPDKRNLLAEFHGVFVDDADGEPSPYVNGVGGINGNPDRLVAVKDLIERTGRILRARPSHELEIRAVM